MADGFLKLAAVAVTAAFGALMMKKQSPEFAFLLAVSAGTGIALVLTAQIPAVCEVFEAFTQYIPDGDETIRPLFKASGICMITKLAAETCRDCEQRSLAAKVELTGTAACLMAAAPLFTRVFQSIGGIL